MSFQEQFGTGMTGAFKMAVALMAGDAATFKQGYTADNAALAVAGVFDVDADDVKDALRRGFVAETFASYNEEGSNFAVVTVTHADGTQTQEHFAQWVDSGEGVESAARQASSFVGSMYEAADYTLEERLGAYGLEWEREQEERGRFG